MTAGGPSVDPSGRAVGSEAGADRDAVARPRSHGPAVHPPGAGLRRSAARDTWSRAGGAGYPPAARAEIIRLTYRKPTDVKDVRR
jgi:hypothetical protein